MSTEQEKQTEVETLEARLSELRDQLTATEAEHRAETERAGDAVLAGASADKAAPKLATLEARKATLRRALEVGGGQLAALRAELATIQAEAKKAEIARLKEQAVDQRKALIAALWQASELANELVGTETRLATHFRFGAIAPGVADTYRWGLIADCRDLAQPIGGLKAMGLTEPENPIFAAMARQPRPERTAPAQRSERPAPRPAAKDKPVIGGAVRRVRALLSFGTVVRNSPLTLRAGEVGELPEAAAADVVKHGQAEYVA